MTESSTNELQATGGGEDSISLASGKRLEPSLSFLLWQYTKAHKSAPSYRGLRVEKPPERWSVKSAEHQDEEIAGFEKGSSAHQALIDLNIELYEQFLLLDQRLLSSTTELAAMGLDFVRYVAAICLSETNEIDQTQTFGENDDRAPSSKRD